MASENHRLGEVHRLEHHRLLLVADGVAGRDASQPDRGGDVAGVDFLDLLALVGVHLEETADALGLLLGGVVDRRSRRHHPRVHPNEGELADERVGHDLERQRGEGRVVGGGPLDRIALGRVGVHADDRRHIERRRQVVHDRVEQRLHALVLERGAAEHRHERRLVGAHRLGGGLAERRLDLFVGDLLAVQVLLEDRVLFLAHLLDELLAVVRGLLGHLRGNLADKVVGAHGLVRVGDRLHPDEVDHADELVFRSDRQLNGDGVALELGADLIEGARKVRADAVHLVHEADARHAVLVGLAPHRLRLRLDAGHRVEHGDGAVEHAQGALDFGREVDVARGVDDVDPVLAPEARGGGRGDRDAALLLLLHPVHHGGAFVHFAYLVRNPGVEQDPFRRRRLSGIDVRHDADVPGLPECDLPGHCSMISTGFAGREPGQPIPRPRALRIPSPNSRIPTHGYHR